MVTDRWNSFLGYQVKFDFYNCTNSCLCSTQTWPQVQCHMSVAATLWMTTVCCVWSTLWQSKWRLISHVCMLCVTRDSDGCFSKCCCVELDYCVELFAITRKCLTSWRAMASKTCVGTKRPMGQTLRQMVRFSLYWYTMKWLTCLNQQRLTKGQQWLAKMLSTRID